MKNYPKTNRSNFLKRTKEINKSDIVTSRKFGKEYFDGDRKYGYGGYHYDPKFFTKVVDDFKNHYNLNANSKVLDIGCGKGFMLYDFKKLIPKISIRGIDISKYCYDNCIPEIKEFFDIGSCDSLPYKDHSFDLVISISTIHNLDLAGVRKSLYEINRVSKKNSFIKINGYKNNDEKEKIEGWNLVAKTTLHEDNWLKLFKEVNYIGDYDFFKP